MSDIFRRLGNSEKGAVLVFVALTLPVILGFSALVIDIGMLMENRRLLQNGVDAAALSGALLLPEAQGNSIATAISYAQDNGIQGGELVTPTVSTTYVPNDTITVSAQRSVPFSFARVLGINSGTVNATAKAASGIVGKSKGVLPWGVENPSGVPGCNPDNEFCFEFGQFYTLKLGPGGGIQGAYQGLAIDGDGSSIYRESLVNGSTNYLTAGTWVPLQTGNMAGPTNQGLNQRIGQNNQTFSDVVSYNSGNTPQYTLLDPDSPRLVILPIVREYSGQGSSTDAYVQGFSYFFVESWQRIGNDMDINGYFIDTTVPGAIWSPAYVNYGTRAVKLLQ